MANRIIRNIPNTLTCLNLLSGCLACAAAFAGDYVQAFAFIVTGAAFDFFDGLAARALHVYSVIGKDLDSLADDVTFGVAPGAMVFMLLREMTVHAQPGGLEAWLSYVAFAIPVFSGLRLAKFNNDARQTTSFIGLPVPANALFWGALIAGQHAWLVSGNVSPLAVAALACLSAWLLVCELPMFSLKFKDLSWQANRLRFLFLAVCIPLLAVLGISGFAAIVVWYILLSLLTCKRKPATKPE